MLNNSNYKVLNLPFKINSLKDETKNKIIEKINETKDLFKINFKKMDFIYKKESVNKEFIIKKRIYKNKKNGEIKEKYEIINNFIKYDFNNLQDFENLEKHQYDNFFNDFLKKKINNIDNIHNYLDLNKFSKEYTNYISYTDFSKYFTNDIKFEEKNKIENNNYYFKRYDFKDEIKDTLEEYGKLNSTEDTILNTFINKNIWIKNSLFIYLKDKKINSIYQIKKALSRFCYMFINGPFKYCYILKGFDPRNNSDNRLYQTFKISVNLFDINNNYYKKHKTYQISEIQNKEIQNLVNNYKNIICDEKYGYFSKNVWKFIKKTTKNLILTGQWE